MTENISADLLTDDFLANEYRERTFGCRSFGQIGRASANDFLCNDSKAVDVAIVRPFQRRI